MAAKAGWKLEWEGKTGPEEKLQGMYVLYYTLLDNLPMSASACAERFKCESEHEPHPTKFPESQCRQSSYSDILRPFSIRRRVIVFVLPFYCDILFVPSLTLPLSVLSHPMPFKSSILLFCFLSSYGFPMITSHANQRIPLPSSLFASTLGKRVSVLRRLSASLSPLFDLSYRVPGGP